MTGAFFFFFYSKHGVCVFFPEHGNMTRDDGWGYRMSKGVTHVVWVHAVSSFRRVSASWCLTRYTGHLYSDERFLRRYSYVADIYVTPETLYFRFSRQQGSLGGRSSPLPPVAKSHFGQPGEHYGVG